MLAVPQQSLPQARLSIAERQAGRGLGGQSAFSPLPPTCLSPYLLGSIFTGGFSNELALNIFSVPPFPQTQTNTHT